MFGKKKKPAKTWHCYYCGNTQTLTQYDVDLEEKIVIGECKSISYDGCYNYSYREISEYSVDYEFAALKNRQTDFIENKLHATWCCSKCNTKNAFEEYWSASAVKCYPEANRRCTWDDRNKLKEGYVHRMLQDDEEYDYSTGLSDDDDSSGGSIDISISW